jgi:hypothetical protein
MLQTNRLAPIQTGCRLAFPREKMRNKWFSDLVLLSLFCAVSSALYMPATSVARASIVWGSITQVWRNA